MKALEDCIITIQKLSNLLQEDREDMPACVNGEILREYLRGTERAQESIASLLESLQTIVTDV